MRSSRSQRVGVAFALLSMLAPQVSLGEALLRRPAPEKPDLLALVPASAAVVLTWGGTSAEGYKGSKFEQLLASPGIQALFRVHLPALIGQLSDSDEAPEAIGKFMDYVRLFGSRPLAMYVELPSGMASEPRVVAMCDGSDDPEALAGQLSALLDGNAGDDLSAHRKGNVFFLVAGGSELPPVEGDIRSNAGYQEAMGSVGGGGGLLTAFVNFAGVVGQVPEGRSEARKVLDSTGFSGLKSLAYSGRIDPSGEYTTRGHLAITGEPKGLVKAALQQRTEPSPLLKRIPSDAVYAGLFRVSLPQLIDATTKAVIAVNPQAENQVQMGWSAAAVATGVDLKLLLTERLGPEFLLMEPRGGEGEVVMMATSADAAAACAAVDTLVAALQRFLLMGGADAGVRLERQFETIGDTKVTTLVAKLPETDEVPEELRALLDYRLMYAHKDGLLILATGRTAMLAGLNAPAADLTTLPAYQALLKRIGAPVTASIGFVDLPAAVQDMRRQAEQLKTLFQLADGELDLGPMLEDLFGPVVPLMAPALEARWSDATGYHFRSATPFPGAELWSRSGSSTSVMVAAPVLAASIALPSLVRARETANRVKSAVNLRMIGQGNMLYANENRGNFADDFGQLLLTQDLGVEVFISPRSSSQVPEAIQNGTPQEKAMWATTNSDYVYLGKGLTSSADPDVILAHERLDIGLDDGINILFADGRVQFVRMKDLDGVLAADKEKRGK